MIGALCRSTNAVLSEWESPAADFAADKALLALAKVDLILLTRSSSSETLSVAASLEDPDDEELPPLDEEEAFADSFFSSAAIFV